MKRMLVLFVLLIAAATPAVPAQTSPEGPYWTTFPVPANFTSVQALGSIVYMRTTTECWFFSGITHNWVAVPVSGPSATVNLCNKYAVVKDGTTFTAFSARTGATSAITVSPSAVLQSAPTSSSWCCIVRDGTTLYGYGAFAGFWDQITMQSATVTVATTSYTICVYDGTFAHAIGCYDGHFQSVAVSGGSVATGAMAAVAYNASQVWCFSAHWNIWMTQTFASTGIPVTRDGFVTFQNGATALAFSSLANTFSSITPTQQPLALSSNRNVAAIADGTTTWCYSPGTGAWTPVATATVPTFSANSEFLFIDDGTGLIAFSGTNGVVSPKLNGIFATQVNDDVAIAQNGTSIFAYSPFTNTWSAAPTASPLSINLVRAAAVLATPTGYEAFSARDGAWHSLTTTIPNVYTTLTTGDVFCAMDGNDLSVFDARFSRWATQTTIVPASLITIWRQLLVANDSINLYGYSLMSNKWDQIALDGPILQQTTNSSIAYARTAATLFVFDGHGSLSTLGRFPEFTRMQPKGTPFTMIQFAQPGSIVTAAVSLAPIPSIQNLGIFGNLFIEPSQVVILQQIGTIPGNGRLDVTATTPNDPAWNGLQLWIQNVVQTPSGSVYLTNALAPMFI